MISLLILDHPGWWTTTGMFFKYAVIAAAVAAGAALFIKSIGAYIGFGWLIIVVLPLFAISVAEQPLELFTRAPPQEQIFIYVWIFLALVELFLIWVPAIGLALRRKRKPLNAPANGSQAKPGGGASGA